MKPADVGTDPATQTEPCGPRPRALPVVANKYSYQNIFLFFLQLEKIVEKNRPL